MRTDERASFVEWGRQHLPEWQGLSASEQLAEFDYLAADATLCLSGRNSGHLPEAIGEPC